MKKSPQRIPGRIIKYFGHPERLYGFAQSSFADGDIFFHSKQVTICTPGATISEGVDCELSIEETSKGLRATAVVI